MPTFSLLQKEKAIKPIFFFKASTDRKLHKYRGFVHVMLPGGLFIKKSLVRNILRFLVLTSLDFCLLITLMYSLAESFYTVKYGLSIIMSKVGQKISVLKTGVSVVFKTKHELKGQNKLFFWKHQVFFLFSLLRIFDWIFDVIIDSP